MYIGIIDQKRPDFYVLCQRMAFQNDLRFRLWLILILMMMVIDSWDDVGGGDDGEIMTKLMILRGGSTMVLSEKKHDFDPACHLLL